MLSVARRVGAIARADFLERTRTHAFLVTLGVTVYSAYLFLPPADAAYLTLRMGNHRGVYDSAWVGCVAALMSAAFLSFAGFYVVKNSVDRDRRTGVGQILAATPLPKAAYTVGKALSNFAVLGSIVAVVAVAAGVMQMALGEDRRLDLAALLLPFLYITLPVMALVAGTAVLFECVPALRGGLGNVGYFFAWGTAISVPIIRAVAGQTLNDPLGLAAVVPDMMRGCAAAFPDENQLAQQFSMGFNFPGPGFRLQTFRWDGPDLAPELLVPRVMWAGVGVALALGAAVPFDRFDTARHSGRRARKDKRDVGVKAPPPSAWSESTAHPGLRTAVRPSFSLATLVAAELGLLLKGLRWWWYAIALGFAVAGLLAPSTATPKLLVLAWTWPMLRWSMMGARERRFGTEELVWSSPRAIRRQLPATWIAGWILALLTGAGAAAHLAVAGDGTRLIGLAVGAFFIPSLALALGSWTGSGKLFEVLYLLFCYAAISDVPFDFTGTSAVAIEAGAPALFALAIPVLVALAVAGRSRSLRRGRFA